ncbi:hypothetical protein A6770_33015 [Nostoc minutum NIES-26]|uniref:Uncharacterized protein n=1 Tax=Nostoc minutum NIES-26 TaxID=1844469 RepID=A0A367Q2R5_9NOSO|nr:hypothetical protein A6770_33015 [Nostoc minutum NIES-26]
MNTEIKLGLCNPPEPIYLYVKSGESSGESYLWYRYDINNDKTIPVQEKGLTGYLTELRLTAKEFRGKDNIKLDIVVNADEVYVIRTGIETNFAKTFLLAASLVQDFSKPLIFAATPGEETVVFCRLYNAITKTRFRQEWDANADWEGIIQSIQTKLSSSSDEESIPTTEQTTHSKTTSKPAVAPPPSSQDLRVKNVRTLLDYPVDLVKEWLQTQNVARPSLLNTSKVDELVRTMCLAWAADKVEHPHDAESSYQKQVVDAVANEADELTTIKEWMNYVLEKKTVVSSR